MILDGPSGEKFIVFQIGQTEDEMVREIFQLTLEHNNGNRSATGRTLGISLRTVRNRIQKYGLAGADEAHEP